jgi:hypothetical protein
MDKGVVLRSELLRAGVAADEVRQRRRRRELVNIRRGAYVDPADERLAEAVTRHRLAIEATVRQLGAGAVVSHVSAAVLLGLPVWGLPLDRVHVTRDRASGARVSRDVHMHGAGLCEDATRSAECYSQWPFGAGTSSVGLRSKKPTGLSVNPV